MTKKNKKYMLLKRGPVKVPLLAVDNSYPLWIGNIPAAYTESQERLLVYLMFQRECMSAFYDEARMGTRYNLTPVDLEKLANAFRAAHVPEPVESYSFQEIPLQADPEKGLDLPIPYYCCTISLENEKILMDKVIQNPYRSVISSLSCWFEDYCHRFNLDYEKKCKGEQYGYLADSFLEQHGISPQELVMNPAELECLEKQTAKKVHDRRRNFALSFVLFLGYTAFAVSVGTWLDKLGSRMESNFGVFVEFIGCFLGLSPIMILFRKRE